MVTIMCLTSLGGMPLFNRSYGNIDAFSFSSLASLNGVHMYGKSHNMLLKSTSTEDLTIVWKDFENSITLISAGVTLDERTLSSFSHVVFNALVMFVGIEELRNVKNVERLRRDLRMSFSTVEKILQAVDLTDSTGPNESLLSYSPALLPPEPELLQSYVDSWSECVASMFVCVVIEGSLAAASSGWWQLDRLDRYLLSLVIPPSDACTSSDIPVFLPVKSPTVPFRLVSSTIMQGIRVVALCGPVPDLAQFEQLATQAWKSCIHLLNECASVYPRNIAPAFVFHELVIGFLLVDDILGKMVISGSVTGQRKAVKCPNHVLRSFYYQCVQDMVLEKGPNESLLSYSPALLPPEPELLQSYVDSWSECVASMFVCVVIEGSLAAASSGWWQLDRLDRYLLSLVIPPSDACTSSDIPVFLPVKSPTVPFRLVSSTIMQGIRVVALCGPVPDLAQFEQLATQAWKSCIHLLNECASVYPRNIAPAFVFHELVIGFLLVDDILGKMVISGSVTGQRKAVKCPNHVLRSFYYQCVQDMVLEKDDEVRQAETYWCAEHYKTFALRQEDSILCLLFSPVVPTPAMSLDTTSMEVAYLPEYLHHCLESGVTLSTEQTSLVQNSLRVLQEQARFCAMYFWGTLYGTRQDYYIAFGVRQDAMDRIFYYSLDGLNWLLIPDPVSQPNAAALTLDCRFRFVGDPMLILSVPNTEAAAPLLGEGDGDRLGEGLYGLEEQGENTESQPRELKEEDRLAVVVKLITEETFVLPRRALFKVPNKIGSIVFNKYFQGLNETEAMRLQNYVHYREPRSKWNMNLVESSAANYSTDFLDPVNEDIPKNKSWCLIRSYDNMMVFSKSLLWHGSIFFHLVDTPLYGNCYFGYGLKNYDLPFMLSPTIP